MNRRFKPLPSGPASALLLALIAAIAPLAAGQSKQAAPELSVVRADILDKEDGYPIDPESTFMPGETVFILFNVGGFTRGQYDRVKLHWRIDSFGPQGERFVEAKTGEIDSELAPQDANWLPIIRHSPLIPPHAGAGTYRVVLTVVDDLAKTEASREVPVYVGGVAVAGSDYLAVRGLAFARSEKGAKLATPAFRPGDQVWMSFYITGYDLGDDNSFHVRSTLRLVNTEGEVILNLPPHDERGSSYYPRRWMPASLRLDLDRTIPAGRYLLLVFLEDEIAATSYQSSYWFEVR